MPIIRHLQVPAALLRWMAARWLSFSDSVFGIPGLRPRGLSYNLAILYYSRWFYRLQSISLIKCFDESITMKMVWYAS
jgi:hypothetical protein